MIESSIDSNASRGHIIVTPNLSAHWRTTKLFLWIVSAFALTIALMFALQGLWMIVPFAGAEVMAIIAVMYHVARKCHHQQVITIEQDRIRVEKGYRRPQLAWESDLFWTRLMITKSPYAWYPDKLILRARQRQIEIGEFLNEADKRQLVARLRAMISVVE